MGAPPKQAQPETLSVAGRKSTRLAIAIPITISGKDAIGHSFKENSRTIIINKHGAKIFTFHQLALGGEVTIENRSLGTSARGNVVWLGDKRSGKGPAEIGVLLTQAGNIWGIEFPPDDWREGPPVGEGGQKLEKPAARDAKPAEPAMPLKPERAEPAPAAAATPPGPPPRPQAASHPRETVSHQPATTGLDAVLGRFAQHAEELANERAKVFEEKLANLSTQFGSQTQATLQDAANRLEGKLEEKMAASLEQKLGNLADRLQASRAEFESLLARFQKLHESSQTEVEKTKRNIEEASFAALKSAMEELDQKAQKQLEAAREDFIGQTRKRLEDEARTTVETVGRDMSARLTKLAEDHLERSQGTLQARVAEATEKGRGQVSQAIEKATVEGVQGFETQLEKAVRKSQEKSAKDVSDYFHKTVEELLGPSTKEFQKYASDAKQALRDEIKTLGKGLSEDARKQLAAFTNTTVESLNKEAKAGLEEFRGHLRKSVQELQDKSARELEAQLEKVALKYRETALNQIEKEAENSLERALAQINTKTAQAAKDASDTVNKHVGSGAVLLKELEEQAGARIEAHSQKLDQSAKTSAEAFENKTNDLTAALLGKLRAELETLAMEFQDRLQKSSGAAHDRGIEDIQARFQSLTEKFVEDSAKELKKLTEENLELVADKLEEGKAKVVNDAEEAFRAKFGEVFSSVLQPGAKKLAERESEESKKPG